MCPNYSLTYSGNGIVAERTVQDIIADVESWAKDRLRSGEETIYLSGVREQVSGVRDQLSAKKNSNTEIELKSEMSKTKKVIAVPTTLSPTPNTQQQIPASDDWKNASDLPMLKSMIEGCTKCELYKTRTNFVFGVGNPQAKVMVIGEAPGADEDKQGIPFVGRAGQLLDKMMIAINFPREQIYIANILKSRPPGNRDPKPDEVAACEPYLWKQIEIIKPKMILCVGRIAGNNLLKLESDSLASMRGKFFDLMGAKVMVTYHPAALLRNPAWKVGAWEDLQKFRKLYDDIEAA
jgi:uracil-DNA glycosylase family 4